MRIYLTVILASEIVIDWSPVLDYRVRSFLAVCSLGSYTRAAAELHITQPAITQHIRALEAHYGCALFERSGRVMRLTPAGELARRRLAVAANDEERLCRELAALANEGARRTLRLGCTRTIADYLAPRLLAHMTRTGGQGSVAMRVGNTAELTAALDVGALDLALVEGSFDRSRFDAEVLSRESYIAVARAGVRATSLEGLLDRELVVREKGSGTREILERLLGAHDVALDDFAGLIELGSIPVIKVVVGEGDAVTFIYRIAVEDELASGALVDVTPPDLALEHDFTGIWERGSLYGDELRALVVQWREHLCPHGAIG